jgi:hypothetical protein
MLVLANPVIPFLCLPGDFVNPFLTELVTAVVSATLLVAAAVLLIITSNAHQHGFRLLVVRLVSYAAIWAVALAASTWLIASTFVAWCAPEPAWRFDLQLQLNHVIPVLVRATEFIAAILVVVAVTMLLRWLMELPNSGSGVRAE